MTSRPMTVPQGLVDKGRLLLIEDDATMRTLVAGVLSPEYAVEEAASAEAAITLLGDGVAQNRSPDLILLDAGLPGEGGLDLCRRIKATPGLTAIPILFLTARVSPADETAAFDVGAVDYITKPFNAAVLRARVRTHLDLKRSRDALERLAYVDGLTGLFNRRAFDDALDREWRRLRRSEGLLSIVICDVDHFKQFNDAYGHGAGDDCLRKVGAAMRRVVNRPADFVARYGGEEFVMLLPGTDLDGAVALARAVGAEIVALRIPHARSSAAPHVTISLGVATGVATRTAEPVALLALADAQLYAAKAAGRNRAIAVRQ